MRKTVLFLFCILFGMFFLLTVTPFIIDVDQYRSQLVSIINQKIQGKLELGQLSLSLWGQIRIEVEGALLQDRAGNEIIRVKKASFHLPLLPLLSGSPVVTFQMKQPMIHIIKQKTGQLNLMTLCSETSAPPPAPVTTVTPPHGTPAFKDQKTGLNLPGFAIRSRLGIEFLNALVSYQDHTNGFRSEITDLSVKLKDISLSHPVELEIFAHLHTQLSPELNLEGPVKITGKAQPSFRSGKFDSISLNIQGDFDQLEISIAHLFKKKKGILAQFQTHIVLSEEKVKFENIFAQFLNTEWIADGMIQLRTHPTSPIDPISQMNMNFNVKSNPMLLNPWIKLMPLLHPYAPSGSAQIEGTVQGLISNPSYHLQLQFSDVTTTLPQLKESLQFNGKIQVIPDQIKWTALTLKTTGGDIQFKGQLISFSHPQLSLEVTSSLIDLDPWIVFMDQASKQELAKTIQNPSVQKLQKTSLKTNPSLDQDLGWLRKNSILKNARAHFDFRFKKLKAHPIVMEDLLCQLNVQNLSARLESCQATLFSGKVSLNAQLNIKPQVPHYEFQVQVADLNMTQAIESQFAFLKNTANGTLHFYIKGHGSSLDPQWAMPHLEANGDLKIENATFATIDIAKMVGDSLDKMIGKLGHQIQDLKTKTVKKLADGSMKYQSITSDFSISQGQLRAPHFFAQAKPQAGIDIKGTTTVGLQDGSLNADWNVIDTYHLTHAQDLSVDYQGVHVDHLLSEDHSPFRFPIHVGCTLQSPCYSDTEVLEFLSKIAFKNITSSVKNKVQNEVKEKAHSMIQQAIPSLSPTLKNKFKGLFH